MEINMRFRVGGRVPGQMVIDALLRAVDSPNCQKKWVAEIKDNHEVTICCYGSKKAKAKKINPGVYIKVLELIDPENMLSHLNVKLIVSGLANIPSERQLTKDFEEIKKEFGKCFDGYPWPYRVFDHQRK